MRKKISNAENRKLNKHKKQLTHKSKLLISDVPTDLIVIANGGIANDISLEVIQDIFIDYQDKIVEYINHPHWTYCILRCHNKDCSEMILETCKLINLTNNNDVGYLYYLISLPIINENEDDNYSKNIPDDLIIIEDVADAEDELMKFITEEMQRYGNNVKQRSVLHYGYLYDYSNEYKGDIKQMKLDREIPLIFTEILLKLDQENYKKYNQCTVNSYEINGGIGMHCDLHSMFEEDIAVISLVADVQMEWQCISGKQVKYLDIKKNSGYVMRGNSRYLWKHGIRPRSHDILKLEGRSLYTIRQRYHRTSITFRQMKLQRQCDSCPCKETCDLINTTDTKGDVSLAPDELERKHVHKVYADIAEHFSETRHSMWPRVAQFIDQQQARGSLIGCDIGCGNGKYLKSTFRGLWLINDACWNLCKIANRKSPGNTVCCDVMSLPYCFSQHSVDFFICIAVLHHISTESRRLHALRQMCSLLVPCGGRGLIYVWSRDQTNSGRESSHYLNQSNNAKSDQSQDSITEDGLVLHQNRRQFQTNDMLVPWTKQQQTFTRYYHLFESGELENLVEQIDPGKVRVAESWYDSGNYAVVLETYNSQIESTDVVEDKSIE